MGTFEDIVSNNLKAVSEIREMGFSPYGRKFLRTGMIGEMISDYQEGRKIKACGRVTALRDHGKTKFFDLKDFSDKVQLYLKKGNFSEEKFDLLKKVTVGDFLGVEGELLKTRTGEITIKVEDFTLLSKSIRPLPEKWHGLKDIEARYRQRYLDLLSNESVMQVFIKRMHVIKAIRNFLDGRGYLEVETPMMQSVPGGALARPFKTHHNALGTDLYLRVAPELYLKRLLVGGFEKVYEINRNFRNEGLSTKHNPEFTMLEIYAAYEDYEAMMDLCEELIKDAARAIGIEGNLHFNGRDIDLFSPWERIRYLDALKKYCGVDQASDIEAIKKKAGESGIEDIQKKEKDLLLNDIFEQEVETRLVSPTFVYDYPKALCPLAKLREDNPDMTERFELIISGSEIANAYSELNNPVEQKKRFEEQVEAIDKEKYGEKTVDYDYVRALEYGMPPAGGLGIGIDRLVMLLTSSESIKDVILFPQLKPEEKK
ncbi:MAG: lysine--tRNA ligase [Candidatus Aureabacteria bacterium]|nr:lysine--tRNA ligase [Candidatus Auribacterota bacterium]